MSNSFCRATCETGDGNTRLYSHNQSLTVVIDYLQFLTTINVNTFQTLVDWLSELFDDSWQLTPEKTFNQGKKFDHSGRSVRGGIVAWRLIEGTDDAEVWFSLGSACIAKLDSLQLVYFLKDLKAFSKGLKVTRLDIALDDYEKRLKPDEIVSAVESGNYAGFRKFDPRFPTKSGKSLGFTLYFGSRESNKFVRFYDKSTQTDGRIDAYRLETEFRRDYSQQIFDQLQSLDSESLPEILPQYLIGLVIGSIDFVDKKDKNLSRCPRLPFWQDFIDACDTAIIKLSAPTKQRTFERTLSWLNRQVQTSFAMLREIFSTDRFNVFLDDYLIDGKARLSSWHQLVIHRAKQDYADNQTDSEQINSSRCFGDTFPPFSERPPERHR